VQLIDCQVVLTPLLLFGLQASSVNIAPDILKNDSGIEKHTRWDIIVRSDGDVVLQFEEIDRFEDREPLADGQTKLLEALSVHDDEQVACY
jgi:hypothetical protein